MHRLALKLLAAAAFVCPALPSQAALPRAAMEELAAKMATELARVCPQAPYGDTKAFQSCIEALKQSTAVPYARDVLWGGDQTSQPIKKRKLTHFNPDVFNTMYLPLMTFTGRWTIGHDAVENVDVIKVEAYFRNALPAGDYPYPFWHSGDKWNAYEVMNQVSFYIDDQGKVFAITRGDKGNNANRGQYANVQPPAELKDKWTWTDTHGQAQPSITLFSARYQAGNPHLQRLDQTYRTFASDMREASCIACHNPANPQKVEKLTLLQTPNHAAGEIDHVIKEIETNSMPQDDLGLPKALDPTLKASILRSAQAFKNEIVAADAWEKSRPARDAMASSEPKKTTRTR